MRVKRPKVVGNTLPVLFRAEKSGAFKGEVTAVFPTQAATYENHMTCYTHLGQHTACSYDWLRGTRPATEEEYQPLLEELWSIYSNPEDPESVKLRIYQRIQAWMDEERTR